VKQGLRELLALLSAAPRPVPHAAGVTMTDIRAVVDDGRSRNGTFVNATRLSGRRRLADGDVLVLGRTAIRFRAAMGALSTATATAAELARIAEAVTPTQRRVLVALCRPFTVRRTRLAVPASNREIAAEVFLSVPAVKRHLHQLVQTFELTDVPDNQKRMRIVEVAFNLGFVARRGE